MRQFFVTILVLSGAVAPCRDARAQDWLYKACASAESVVTGVIRPAQLSSSPALFELTVGSVIKGAIPEAVTVVVSWPGSLTAARLASDGYRALWFLRRAPSGALEIVPIGGPNAPLFASALAVPARDRTRITPPAGACYEAVFEELKDSAEHADESLEYRVAAETFMREARNFAVVVPHSGSVLREFTNSKSVNLRTLALAARIRAQDLGALALAEADLAAVNSSELAHFVALALASWRDPAPEAIESLGRILGRPDAKLYRSYAAEALMMVHTKEAVPYLVSLLANPAEKNLQDTAIRGLSLFVRGAPVLTGERLREMAYLTESGGKPFLDDAIAPFVAVDGVPEGREAEFSAAWKAWWARLGSGARWELGERDPSQP